MPTRQQAEHFETDGYFIADDAVDPDLFDNLAAAARRVKHKVRSGQVDVYTHWATDENTEPWAIRGLLAPEFDEPVFAEYLMSKPVMDYVDYFIGTDLTLGSILLFTNPHHADYSIGWHRDWGKLERDPDYDAEMAILGKPLSGWRWHLATVDERLRDDVRANLPADLLPYYDRWRARQAP